MRNAVEFILFLCGCYLSFLMVRMKNSGEVQKALVSPRLNVNYVRDKEGYINYLFLRGLISGLVISACAIVELIFEAYNLSGALLLIVRVLYVVGIVYFSACCAKGQRKFLIRQY